MIQGALLSAPVFSLGGRDNYQRMRGLPGVELR
jgi:hypothetical protein